MLPFEDEFSRQRRLAEVGPSGQRAIESATLRVARYSGAPVETTYLLRAGARPRADASYSPLPFPHAGSFAHPVSRSFAWGAWSALRQLKNALSQQSASALDAAEPSRESV